MNGSLLNLGDTEEQEPDWCPIDFFKYRVNMNCYFGDSPYILSVLFALLALIFLIVAILMFRKSLKLIKEMTHPKFVPGSEEETYNILSLDIIVFTKLMLSLTIILLVILIIEMLIGEYYSDVFESARFKLCSDS